MFAQLRRGFTLVELLVVIGIIALLISILMPALAKARQHAAMIDCAARMRQMGQGISMYVNESRGYLPAGYFNFTANLGAGQWHISATISRMLGKANAVQNDLSPIFSDDNTPDCTRVGQRVKMNYNFHPRLFPDWVNSSMFDPDVLNGPTKGKPFPLMKLTRVRRGAELVAAYDGTAVFDSNWMYNNACDFSMHVQTLTDTGVWWTTNGFDNKLNTWCHSQKVVQPSRSDKRLGSVDFRHAGGRATNVLMLDGHVESRKLGELFVKDFILAWR